MLAPSEDFVRLFTLSQRSLYLFILVQVGSTQDAEEILQETNLVIWSKCDQFGPGTNFGAWARQIARYEILKSRQKKRRDKLLFSDEFLATVGSDADRRGEDVELKRKALEHCLGKLRAEDRRLIRQRYQPGQTGKEIAEAIGRPANSVYQSLGRIRRVLAECVQRQLAVKVDA